jgi:hypothetical protein
MVDPNPNPNPDPNPNPNPNPNPATPWHQGLDAEIIGHAQNKGWKLDDPKEAFAGAVKQARELERHFGVPPEQLLKIPKNGAPPEDVKAFRMKLGMPAEAKDYDFAAIKHADGAALDTALADSLRVSAHNSGLSKEAAAEMAKAVVKHMDDAKSAVKTVTDAKLAEEKAKLQENWGTKFQYNHIKAMEAAQRLGPEFAGAVAALEGQVGYAKVMDLFRRIGISGSEDIFVERGTAGEGTVTTQAGAVARKAELMADREWTKRLDAGDAKTVAEWKGLNRMIDGDA